MIVYVVASTQYGSAAAGAMSTLEEAEKLAVKLNLRDEWDEWIVQSLTVDRRPDDD